LLLPSGRRTTNQLLVIHSPSRLDLSALKLKRTRLNAFGGQSAFYSFEGFSGDQIYRWAEGKSPARRPASAYVRREAAKEALSVDQSVTGSDSDTGYAAATFNVKELP